MDKKVNHLYEFEDYRVDLDHRCLWRGRELVSLTPKAFETLVVLIKNRGTLVAKDRLLNEVWADTFVEESTLAQNISTLRKTLSLSPNGTQFIETVPKRGYRFVGDVREIFGDEEFLVVETHTRTHIVAERQEIHDSGDAQTTDISPKAGSVSAKPTFLTKNKFLLSAVVGFLMCAGLLAAAWIGLRWFSAQAPNFENRFREFQVSKLTSNGDIYKVAISPDGKYVALVEKKGESQTLFVRQTANANQLEIIPPTKNNFIGVTFSPDSDFIYYAVYQEKDPDTSVQLGVLYKVPILGGTRTEILIDIDSPVAISPDKKKYAFVRHIPGERQSALMLFDCAGAGETKLATRALRDRFSGDSVSWSPDGKKLAALAYNSNDVSKPFEIIIINVENGEQTILPTQSWMWIGQLAWLADGSGLVFSAFGENSPNMTDEIWFVSYPEGRTRQITNGVNGFFGLGITNDAGSLVTVKSDRVTSLWMSPKDDPNAAVMINKGIGDNSSMKLGVNWTTDGQILYSSVQNGNADIWLVNRDGTNPKQLTNDKSADFNPLATADGRYIIFISNRAGGSSLWRMDFDGTHQIQLSNLKNTVSPSVSPDGRWVYFGSSESNLDRPFLWKVSIDGGEVARVTNSGTYSPQLSPDGKYIACYFPEKLEDPKSRTKTNKLTILSAADAAVIRQFDEPQPAAQTALLWTPDGKAVSYLMTENGVSNIWVQPVDGGPRQKITNLQSEQIFRYGWSRDYKTLVFEKGMSINDIVILRDKSPKQ